MRELLGVAVAAALSSTAVACALVARDVSLPRSPNGVSVAFDHLGLAANPLDARIANTEPSKAAQLPGSDYWFRVRNGSGEAISITAFGMYFKLPFEWYSLPDGTRVLSVEDGADVSVVF